MLSNIAELVRTTNTEQNVTFSGPDCGVLTPFFHISAMYVHRIFSAMSAEINNGNDIENSWVVNLDKYNKVLYLKDKVLVDKYKVFYEKYKVLID